jgi:hypothetical protein
LGTIGLDWSGLTGFDWVTRFDPVGFGLTNWGIFRAQQVGFHAANPSRKTSAVLVMFRLLQAAGGRCRIIAVSHSFLLKSIPFSRSDAGERSPARTQIYTILN